MIIDVAHTSGYKRFIIPLGPKTQNTLKGNNLTLTCSAASTSPAEMTFVWKKDSESITDILPDCSNTKRSDGEPNHHLFWTR